MEADWLRTQLSRFACGSCGRSYRASHIKVLAQREELFFVDLSCRSCGAQAVAIVTVQVDESERVQVDAGELTPAGGEPEPITADDVLAMHEFLGDFDGDFRALFRSGDRRRRPGT